MTGPHAGCPRPARLPGTGAGGGQDEPALPGWRRVLAVVAHPDDETFGLGAVIAHMTSRGTAVHVLCFTRGEASTLNANDADLYRVRETELHAAADELGVASVTLLDYPDGQLASVPEDELAGQVSRLAGHLVAEGMLAFDESGITGHPDHQAATRAAVRAAGAGLPVLAWTLTEPVAAQLRAETGQPFAGRPPADTGPCLRVDRSRQRHAAVLHASQIPPGAVLWRRLDLQAGCEHLHWLVPVGES